MIKIVKTKCEVYSRIVGYLRPIDNWNDGKKAEYYDRKYFDDAIDLKKGDKNSKNK